MCRFIHVFNNNLSILGKNRSILTQPFTEASVLVTRHRALPRHCGRKNDPPGAVFDMCRSLVVPRMRILPRSGVRAIVMIRSMCRMFGVLPSRAHILLLVSIMSVCAAHTRAEVYSSSREAPDTDGPSITTRAPGSRIEPPDTSRTRTRSGSSAEPGSPQVPAPTVQELREKRSKESGWRSLELREQSERSLKKLPERLLSRWETNLLGHHIKVLGKRDGRKVSGVVKLRAGRGNTRQMSFTGTVDDRRVRLSFSSGYSFEGTVRDNYILDGTLSLGHGRSLPIRFPLPDRVSVKPTEEREDPEQTETQ